jgi:hypothetical protein
VSWLVGIALVGAPACTASVSAGFCEVPTAGEGAGAGLVVCSSGVAAVSWLGFVELELTGAGDLAEVWVAVGRLGLGTVSWAVGVGLVGVLACAASVWVETCAVAGTEGAAWVWLTVGWPAVGSKAWPVEVELAEAVACTVCVSVKDCDVSCAGAGACVWLFTVCWSGAVTAVWLFGVGLTLAGAGEVTWAGLGVCWSGAVTVAWLVGAGLVLACGGEAAWVRLEPCWSDAAAAAWPVGAFPPPWLLLLPALPELAVLLPGVASPPAFEAPMAPWALA